MARFKCTIQYDGTKFHGYQIQPDKRTVQGELEKVLANMHKSERVQVYGAGRTDAGVHAMGQVIHFDSSLKISGEAWKRAFNAQLPDDVSVSEVEEVHDDFHARFDALEKEYRYFLLNQKDPDPFRRHFVYHFPPRLDIDKINQACEYLKGTHDFTTFSSPKSTVRGSKVRTLYEASCVRNGNEVVFIFKGNGFLYNMVRILVGVLIDIGQGKMEPTEVPYLFEKRDRTLAGKTMEPHGLYMWKITYP